MTGYGRGVAEREGRRAVVEIRSVNHRFLDLKLRGSSLEPAVEAEVTGAVRGAVSRGSVTVTVRLERRGAAAALSVDHQAARRVHDELAELARVLRAPGPGLELVCAQPGVLVPIEAEAEAGLVTAAVIAALGEALERMVAMRDAEGATLDRDLRGRLTRVGELVESIAGAAAGAPDEQRARLEERIGRLLASSKVDVDEARLAQEVALVADKVDITEELVRLRSHIGQVGEVAGSEGAIGRRLDFLVQEMGRELNTIGSKSQSAEIAGTVVEAKAELEKIREQVQNIE